MSCRALYRLEHRHRVWLGWPPDGLVAGKEIKDKNRNRACVLSPMSYIIRVRCLFEPKLSGVQVGLVFVVAPLPLDRLTAPSLVNGTPRGFNCCIGHVSWYHGPAWFVTGVLDLPFVFPFPITHSASRTQGQRSLGGGNSTAVDNSARYVEGHGEGAEALLRMPQPRQRVRWRHTRAGHHGGRSLGKRGALQL